MTTPCLLICLAAALPPGTPPPDDEAEILQEVFVQAVERAAPSVVTIEVFGMAGRTPKGGGRRNPLQRPGLIPGRGPSAGVILSEDGEILTSSFHFPSDPAAIVVTLPEGERHAAKLVARDFSRGIALLEIDAGGLPVARFAPPGSVRVGQWALALGRSFSGDLPAPQMGIVSALDRISGRAIQTDAPTSPANYGGPLIDIEGTVLGIIAPLSPRGERAAVETYDSGIGFAIPLWDLERVIHRLRAGETLHPGFLGVEFDRGSTEGSLEITRVLQESAAEEAGILAGDRILRVGNRPVRSSFELRREIGRAVAGDRITLLLRRGDEEIQLRARLGRRPEPTPPPPEDQPD